MLKINPLLLFIAVIIIYRLVRKSALSNNNPEASCNWLPISEWIFFLNATIQFNIYM